MSKSFALNGSSRTRYAGNEIIPVVQDLSLNIQRGKVTALIGGNGAGKTTLFNVVSGLLKPDKGTITYISNEKEHECHLLQPYEISRLGIGRMFQGIRIFEKLTIYENLALFKFNINSESPFYTLFHKKAFRLLEKDIKTSIRDILEKIPGTDNVFLNDLNKPAGNLSYAQQRLLSMIGLFLGEYDLILMDEPTSGINYESIGDIRSWIKKFMEIGKTVFLIEHNMNFVKEIADYCHYMASGKILYSGQPKEVFENAEVRNEYLI
ncbi:MAG: ABC transporter ATP-binding protein [Bacteroidetes bacterium]|nr:ABC transporter ATP-binding protein [Bacteroidota bacterium]